MIRKLLYFPQAYKEWIGEVYTTSLRSAHCQCTRQDFRKDVVLPDFAMVKFQGFEAWAKGTRLARTPSRETPQIHMPGDTAFHVPVSVTFAPKFLARVISPAITSTEECTKYRRQLNRAHVADCTCKTPAFRLSREGAMSSSSVSDDETLNIFDEPDGYYEPEAPPTTVFHHTLSGQKLALRLVGRSPLWVGTLLSSIFRHAHQKRPQKPPNLSNITH